ARIGMVTSEGLTSNIKKHYSKSVLFFVILLSVPAIVLNISADIAGMGAVAHLLVPCVPSFVFSIIFTVLLILCLTFLSYERIVGVLKYLCFSILLYLIIPFITKTHWLAVIKSTFTPSIQFNKEYFSVLVAILGTTISPYLFFWQATMEAQNQSHRRRLFVDKHSMTDMKTDVAVGMFFSNLVMYFIILTTGIILFQNGIHQIDTVEQAAKALEPLAGEYSYFLFALGIVGTGFLAIPVLSGSLAYILSTTFGWKTGLDKKYYEAKNFYFVVVVSLILGLLINLLDFNPIQALFYTAVLYGVTAPVLIILILLIANNKKIMGKQTNGIIANTLGILTFLLMLTSALLLIYFLFA
ncbi:MAG: divalent metal cation transporter, partial [bacterium]|nr:divalent metal cation transporter [bacterium]